MPLSLGLGAAGKAASAFGGSGKAGPKATETDSKTSATTGTQAGTQTPNLNPLMAGFQSSLVPALSDMYAKAQTPVYGAQQIAQVANAGDTATTAASNALSNNLARRGALDSGAEAAGQTALQQGNESNTVGFENNIPLLNYQNEMQQTGNVLGLSEALTGKALTTSTGIGSNTELGTSSGTSAVSGPSALSSILTNLGGGLSNASAGAGGKMGGGKGGAPAPTADASSYLGDLLGNNNSPAPAPTVGPSGYIPPGGNASNDANNYIGNVNG